jgi:hypothetical protein
MIALKSWLDGKLTINGIGVVLFVRTEKIILGFLFRKGYDTGQVVEQFAIFAPEASFERLEYD